MHQILDAYMWLSNKFEHQFIEYELAYVLRSRVTDLINQILAARTTKYKIFADENDLFMDEDQYKEKIEILI